MARRPHIRRKKRRRARRHHAAVGAPPGELHPTEAQPCRIRAVGYDADGLQEETLADIGEVAGLRARWRVLWLDIEGLDHRVLTRLGEIFAIHSLVLEDIAHTEQRPKVEEYADFNFIVLRAPAADNGDTEQLAILLEANTVITVHETPVPGLDAVRDRLHGKRGRIRQSGADYLCYAVMDATVDHFIPILDAQADRIEQLEQDILAGRVPDAVVHIQDIKQELQTLRRAIWPMRDVLTRLFNEEIPLFGEELRPYLRDLHDHTIRLQDTYESCRESASSLMDLHLSTLSQRLNEVMKVLTIISTIFIPLSFIAGLYGMNFDRMPELHHRWGYPLTVLIMLAVASVMLLYFHRRGWLGGRLDSRGAPDPGRHTENGSRDQSRQGANQRSSANQSSSSSP